MKLPKGNRLVRLLHVYISMFMLVIMLFFTVTGITLNHPDWFSSFQTHTKTTINVPIEFQASDLWSHAPEAQTEGLLEWLQVNHNVHGQEIDHEWMPVSISRSVRCSFVF